MTGGWKQKSGWIQIPPASCVPFTFPFLSQPSVCLIVSRVRAYLTTDQHCAWACLLSTTTTNQQKCPKILWPAAL